MFVLFFIHTDTEKKKDLLLGLFYIESEEESTGLMRDKKTDLNEVRMEED